MARDRSGTCRGGLLCRFLLFLSFPFPTNFFVSAESSFVSFLGKFFTKKNCVVTKRVCQDNEAQSSSCVAPGALDCLVSHAGYGRPFDMVKFGKIAGWISTASMVVDAYNVVSGIISVVAAGGTVAAFVKHFPAYATICLASISALSFIYAIVRALVSYRRWIRAQNDPNLAGVLDTLWDMHRLLGSLAAGHRGVKVGDSVLASCSSALHRLTGLDAASFAKLAQLPYDKGFDQMYKRNQRVYKYRISEILSLTSAFCDVAKAMELSHIGIGRSRRNQRYQALYDQLRKHEVHLNLSRVERIYSVDQALDFSYGIHSLALMFVFMKQNSNWAKNISQSHMGMMENAVSGKDSVFTVALMQLRAVLIKDMVKGA